MINNGQFTTLATVPVNTTISSPKFVFLGSGQHGNENGNVEYRIGRTVRLEGDQSFDALRKIVDTPLANGQVSVTQRNEHLHLYGWAHDSDEKRFAFHLVVENVPDGQIAASFAAMSGNVSVGQFAGTLSNGASHFAPNGKPIPLRGLSLDGLNTIALQDYEGHTHLLNFAIDELAVDCGVIDRSGVDYVTQRQGSALKLFVKDPHSQKDPFEHHPITLPSFDPSSRFSLSLAPIVLSHNIMAGYVPPQANASSSRDGIDNR